MFSFIALITGGSGLKQKQKEKRASSEKKGGKQSWLAKNRLGFLLLLLVFVVFGNSIPNGYNLDDDFYVDNGSTHTAELIRKGFAGIPEIFRSRTFQHSDGASYSYRPVVAASFAVETGLFGQKPKVSHFISVLLYALTVLVLFALLKSWFPAMGEWFAFLTALLFLVHPLHTEVVDNIKSRDELLMLLFGLSTLYFGWQYHLSGKKIFLFIYPVCFFLGILSKTSVGPFFVLFPLSFLVFGNTGWKKALVYTLPLLGMLLITALMVKFMIPASVRNVMLHENPMAVTHVGWATRTATGFYVMGRYLLLHLVPYPLVYYYGSQYVPLVGWNNIIAILSFLLHAGAGVLAVIGLRRKTVWGWALAIYLGNIFLFSNIPMPAPGLMAERFAYGASIGFCLLLAWMTYFFFGITKDRSAPVARPSFVLLALAGAFALLSFTRNRDWKDKKTLYTHDMPELEESANANMLYAMLLSTEAMKSGDYSKLPDAVDHFKKTIAIFPGYAIAHNNLGNAQTLLRDFDGARVSFLNSLKYDSTNKDTYFNLGIAYYNLGKKDSAMAAMLQAVRYDSSFAPGYISASAMLDSAGRFDASLALMKTALRQVEEKDRVYHRLGESRLSAKDTAGALAWLETGSAKYPENLNLLHLTVNVYHARRDTAHELAALDRLIGSLSAAVERQSSSGQENNAAYAQQQLQALRRQRASLTEKRNGQ